MNYDEPKRVLIRKKVPGHTAMTTSATYYLGVDTGGTFTDFVLYDGQSLRIHKRLSTPAAPEQTIIAGIEELGLDPRGLQLVHGSTVATNAVLEGKGVRTAFITNRGFKDLLSIGRQARRELYNLQPAPIPPPVPSALCLETGGRLAADGALLEPLSDQDLLELRQALQDLAPQAVAINLLFSFRDDRFEKAIANCIPPDIFISRSSEILPEYREYERGIATWLNAWVGPLVQGYLTRLQQGLPGAGIAVMQSAGDTMDLTQAGRHAVRMLLSGPAGGLAGARFIGSQCGQQRLLSFDMGGTSTDVALIDGDIHLTNEGHIGPYPVAVPMVDMHTIGAGGGSIARVDAGGLLQVGPQSAGADPGPACYGHGGGPTVSDANLILGRLPASVLLGGHLQLDVAAARQAISPLAAALGLSIEEAALGIVRVADEHMVRALRVISTQRGIDPRQFSLFSFGGAGGLHVCALAEALDMRHAIVPIHAGVLSALGMLAAARGRRLSRTVSVLLQEVEAQTLSEHFADLERQGRDELQQEGVSSQDIRSERSVDLRYRGQSSTLNIPWQNAASAGITFHHEHEARYGHRLDLAIELVNLRVRIVGPPPRIPLIGIDAQRDRSPPTHTELYGVVSPVPMWERMNLRDGETVHGPALIADAVSTTYLAPAWRCQMDRFGNLLLERD
jgi:N-methylhydantoinase A